MLGSAIAISYHNVLHAYWIPIGIYNPKNVFLHYMYMHTFRSCSLSAFACTLYIVNSNEVQCIILASLFIIATCIHTYTCILSIEIGYTNYLLDSIITIISCVICFWVISSPQSSSNLDNNCRCSRNES